MINSWNEWDPLEEVVVGIADHANWPTTDPVFAEEASKTLWTETPVPSGAVPQWIIDEANEDLNELANTIIRWGAVVRRPEPMNFVELGGMYNYCPRDRLLIAGNTVVDVNMMYPCRNQEIQALSRVIEGSKIVTMPRDQGMTLDAANICRLNDTWLFLESYSGNRAAYDWLCEQFPKITIELCNFYAGVHIDSTIVPLREGLVLLNAHRVTPDNCPKVFDSWEKIYVDDVVAQGFYQYPYASKWIALNMLVLDTHTVIVDRHQTQLIKTLEKHRFTVIPLELRHSRTLGGGFHCVTLDTRRKHA
ncbi:COG1834 N-Dimethylarginine dimethylaminohydrolase [uncultured Caudovirales phage]|uniref:COG1834 N-Dimethylarginine dimethylaminohydrolase n=1 Tax=uncultured Caudovirales phage TaxID=2100421 RepID=A0A6J5LUT5_9CAUD|nr:COG1834 N-Dimethylarginine dimethylaminohydrolase [uncultured Caudovirales phage]